MIDFINLEDGRIFNGNPPYVFWFKNGQSVNLNYVRKICFISKYSTVYVHLNSPVFTLLKLNQNIPALNDPDNPNNRVEIINAKVYMNLEELKVNKYTSVGAKYDDFYVHMIYIMANSKDAGEIRDNFYIIENDGETSYKYEYTIGADFYIDNEILKNELENFDISIPESIQKAIYDVDVHEESNDNITLNRKYKELLMNYWDIVANKGSYNSLQNSLAWFEWGDLVRIEEIWKRHHEGMEDYFAEILNRELSDEFIKQFLNNSKTTGIGLYLGIYNYIHLKNSVMEYELDNGRVLGADPDLFYPSDFERMNDEGTAISENYIRTPYTESDIEDVMVGNYVYINYIPLGDDDYTIEEVLDFSKPGTMVRVPSSDENLKLHTLIFQICTQSIKPHYIYQEPNPRLRHINTKWQYLDLCLKMTLLGNFYSTYFMPIHMDLIHSTIEHWVFTNALKLIHTSRMDKYEKIQMERPFELDYENRTKIKKYRNHTYSDTLFRGHDMVFGFDGTIHDDIDPDFVIAGEFAKYPYDCMAGVIHFQTIFDHQGEFAENPILAINNDEYIDIESVTWKCEGRTGIIVSHKPIHPSLYSDIMGFDRDGFRKSQYVYDFGFDLAFTEAGEYSLKFEFHTTSGNIWVNYARIIIEDNISNHIDLYRVKKLSPDVLYQMELTDPENFKTWFNPFQMMASIDPYDDLKKGTHLGTARSDHEYTPYRDQSIFIKPFQYGSVGFNQTVIFTIVSGMTPAEFKYKSGRKVTVDFNGIGNPERPDDISIFIKYFSGNMKDFMWFASPWPLNPQIPQMGIRMIGIARKYDTEILDTIEGMDVEQGDPYVISMRFHPCLHEIEPFDDTDNPITPSDLIYMEPILGHSKDITISNWKFRNTTMQEEYNSHLTEWRYYPDGKNYGDFGDEKPGGMRGFFVTPPEPINLKPGYYNIYITYRKGEEILQHEFKSAFIIGK